MKGACLVVASFPDSIIRFRGELLESMRINGLSVNVVAPGLPVGSEQRSELEARGIVVHDVPLQRTGMNPVFDLLLLWNLYRLCLKLRPVIFLGYTSKPVIYGSVAAWLGGVPHRFALITGLGYAFASKGQRGRLRRLIQAMYRVALSTTHKVFFQNADDECLFRDRGILSPETPSVVVHGSGVDLLGYSLAPMQAEPVKFLLIARLLGDKGVREYAEAARRVRRLYPEVRFALVGWLDQNPDAISRTELEEWMAYGTVDFLGRLVDVRPAIADCSVFVLPSYREGTPRTVLEAMAMGRPIITTDAPGCRETVVDGDNGFLVPVKSIDALVAAMLRFINDPELSGRMGRRSRQIAEDKYDVHKVNEVMLREMGITERRVPKVTQDD